MPPVTIIMPTPAISPPYETVVLADNPVAYWRLGESVGPTAVDEIGPFNGTYIGSPTLGVAGLLTGDADTAVDFDGSTQYVSVANPTNLATSGAPFSVEAWVNFNTIAPSTFPTIMKLKSNGVNAWTLFGASTSPAGYDDISFGAADTFGIYRFQVPPTFELNIHHIVVTYNGLGATTIGNYNAYVDGAPSALSPGSGLAAITNVTELGHATAPTSFFGGTLDEVAIYNAELSPGQVLTHYNAGT